MLFSLGLLLIFARFLGELAERFNQPSVLGEILAGVILGPTILGAISPNWYYTLFPPTGGRALFLNGFTTIAITLFLLVAGMEVDLSVIWKQGKAASIIGIFGMIIPFFFGFVPALLTPQIFGGHAGSDPYIFALFFATALSISALPVIAKTLMDLNLYRSDLGMIIIAAAIFNDIVGWILFAVILGMIGTGSILGISVGSTIFFTILFAILSLTLFRYLINMALPWIQAHTSWPGGVLGFALSLALFCAAFTEWIGVHAIFGSFLIGVAIGDSSHLREHTRNILNQFISFIFAPLFFASIGLKVNFFAQFDIVLVLIVLLIACIGKIVGCGIGAKLSGLSEQESWAIGFGMNARGAMEIILGLLALQYKLIDEKMFVALVVMALVTSIISGPMMQKILRNTKPKSFIDFMSQKIFIHRLKAATNIEAIEELSRMVAATNNIDFEFISQAVCDRELMMSTGVGNGLAIPHARINSITQPIIALGISEIGIDFNSPEGENANVIFLILTPAADTDIQLKILADIASLFREPKITENMIKMSSFTEFKALVNTLK